MSSQLQLKYTTLSRTLMYVFTNVSLSEKLLTSILYCFNAVYQASMYSGPTTQILKSVNTKNPPQEISKDIIQEGIFKGGRFADSLQMTDSMCFVPTEINFKLTALPMHQSTSALMKQLFIIQSMFCPWRIC